MAHGLRHRICALCAYAGPACAERRVQLGPLVIHPLLYHFPQFFYRRWLPHSQLQTCVTLSHELWLADDGPHDRIVYALVMIHFVKRELESILCAPALSPLIYCC